ncbi:MAG: cytochrome c [Polyangiaceae bacterium]
MLSVLGLTGCVGPGPYQRGGAKVGVLTVREVAWNPGRAEIGHVSHVADSGEDTLILSSSGAFFFVNGALVGSDRRNADWRAAAPIPAADGQGTWLVGLDGEGALSRVRARTSMERISDRYGLGSRRVQGLGSLGQGLAGFTMDDPPLSIGATELSRSNFAVADGARVSAFDLPLFHVFAGGAGKAAWAEPQGVRVLAPALGRSQFYELPGATRTAFDTHGRLFVGTHHEIYAEDATGRLSLVYETGTEDGWISGLVASGDRVWFADGADLGVVEGSRAAVTPSPVRRAASQLEPSASGDVWSLWDGGLVRFAVEQIRYPEDEKASSSKGVAPDKGGSAANQSSRWRAEIAPIFARACASCHGPGSTSTVDLSTSEAWQSHLPSLRRRVLEQRDMPPRGRPFNESDRSAVAHWLDAPPTN